ncbi:SMI1/KNR4 family protein [Evansella tamaricis]|uniref:SMI1/KNR4 family protein n=1 Tax=Evansella tamaricis TaxID=2069301 RepID=A0ABS6JL62_9BACI|nr:SMI1/KNR4 family protein [Evansella tamaricis]MBU9714326.1 SMI1/KNR4 family protein [Evansella tamaricis]
MGKIQWRFSKGEIDSSILSEVERFFHMDLPPAYKELMLFHNGARPLPNCIRVSNGEISRKIVVKTFLPIGRNYHDNLVQVSKRLSETLTKDYVPFANDSVGNYFCFHKETGQIVFWNHELDSIFPVANTLEDFLNKLF